MADLITLVSLISVKRTYPHVTQVKDWAASATARLLWDRVWDLEARLQTAEANVKNSVGAVNTLNTNLAGVKQTAQQAFALAQTPSLSSTPSSGPPGSTPAPCDDDGQAGAGVGAAGPNGDVGMVPHDAFNAGTIIGGTANEYSALLNPTIDQPTRDANTVELLRRMIWHLNQAGFVAGRQRNPSSAISGDKLTVGIGADTIAYDVFQGVDFTQPLPVHANRVCPADYVADDGIPD